MKTNKLTWKDVTDAMAEMERLKQTHWHIYIFACEFYMKYRRRPMAYPLTAKAKAIIDWKNN